MKAYTDFRTQKEDKNYAEVVEGIPNTFWFPFCALCETFASSAFGCPFPHLES